MGHSGGCCKRARAVATETAPSTIHHPRDQHLALRAPLSLSPLGARCSARGTRSRTPRRSRASRCRRRRSRCSRARSRAYAPSSRVCPPAAADPPPYPRRPAAGVGFVAWLFAVVSFMCGLFLVGEQWFGGVGVSMRRGGARSAAPRHAVPRVLFTGGEYVRRERRRYYGELNTNPPTPFQ